MRSVPNINTGVSFGINLKADNFSWADWDIRVVIGPQTISARWLTGNLPARESDGITLSLSGNDLRVNIDNVLSRKLGTGQIWGSVILTNSDRVEKRGNIHFVTILGSRETIEAPTTEFEAVVIFDDPVFQTTIQMFDRVGIDGEDGQGVEVIDDLLSTSTTSALSANQGNILNQRINNTMGNVQTILDYILNEPL